jgi:hypothetical protein
MPDPCRLRPLCPGAGRTRWPWLCGRGAGLSHALPPSIAACPSRGRSGGWRPARSPRVWLSPAGRLAGSRRRAGRQPLLLGEADLLPLYRGVVEGGDDDELVAVPLGGLAEFDVERFSGRGIAVPSGRVISGSSPR